MPGINGPRGSARSQDCLAGRRQVHGVEAGKRDGPEWAHSAERRAMARAREHLPAEQEMKTTDWTKFEPNNSILTEAECDQANGRFVPQLFGWMLHVYPFAETPKKIWAHEPHL